MSDETKRTDITGALERTLDNLNVLTALRPDKWAALQADAALLRSLAAACKAYREAEDTLTAIGALVYSSAVPASVLAISPDQAAMAAERAESALLALARGETPNNPEHTTDG